MYFITRKDYTDYLNRKNNLEETEEDNEYEIEPDEEIYDKKLVQEIDKVHDKMFRNILSIKQEAVKFINEFLKLEKQIKEEEIAQCKTDFITKNYKSKQSDIIYRYKEKPIYFLIEHQSRKSKNMTLRIWEYIGEIIRTEKELQKTYFEESVYPIVVPIVIYTGYQKWELKGNLAEEQYQTEELKKYEINMKYGYIKLEDYTFEELLNKKSLLGIIMIIEKCNGKEEIEKYITKAIENIQDENERIILAEIIGNTVRGILGDKKTEEMIEKLERKEEIGMSPFTKTLLDLKIKSEKEGSLKSLLNVAKKMLDRNMETKEIEEITGLTKEEIEKK